MRVWVSTIRAGLAYHRYDPMDRTTPCGRYHTGEKGRVIFGHVIGLEEAQGMNMTACARCYGTGEVVQPGNPRY